MRRVKNINMLSLTHKNVYSQVEGNDNPRLKRMKLEDEIWGQRLGTYDTGPAIKLGIA